MLASPEALMLHHSTHVLPFALAAGLTFSESAQAPSNDWQITQIWSTRDGTLHEWHEFAPSPRTELSPADIGPGSVQPRAPHSELLDTDALTFITRSSDAELVSEAIRAGFRSLCE
jgi:hypothetical protein